MSCLAVQNRGREPGSERLSDWLNDGMNERSNEWKSKWWTEQTNEWNNEGTNEFMNVLGCMLYFYLWEKWNFHWTKSQSFNRQIHSTTSSRDHFLFCLFSAEHCKQKEKLTDRGRNDLLVQPRKVSRSQRNLRCICRTTTRSNEATGTTGKTTELLRSEQRLHGWRWTTSPLWWYVL